MHFLFNSRLIRKNIKLILLLMKTPVTDLDPELEALKTKINLSEFLASKGYSLVKDKTTPNSVCMAFAEERLIITKAVNGHWIYFRVQRSENDIKEGGSIINYLMNRSGKNIGQIRQELRPWLGFVKRPKISPESFVRSIKPMKGEEINLLQQYHDLKSIDKDCQAVNYYLTGVRKIPLDIILHKRFESKIKTDKYNNAIFPHWFYSKVVGWEMKNKNFTGFPKNSTKSVWFSERFDTDDTLILFESGIDALSFYALETEYLNNSCCISTAGSWGTETEEMMKATLSKYPFKKVMAAFDNNEPGRMFDRQVAMILADLKLHTTDFEILKSRSDDWNDDLNVKSGK